MKKAGLIPLIAYFVGLFISIAVLIYFEKLFAALGDWWNVGKAILFIIFLNYALAYNLILLICSLALLLFSYKKLDIDLSALYWAIGLYTITSILIILYL